MIISGNPTFPFGEARFERKNLYRIKNWPFESHLESKKHRILQDGYSLGKNLKPWKKFKKVTRSEYESKLTTSMNLFIATRNKCQLLFSHLFFQSRDLQILLAFYRPASRVVYQPINHRDLRSFA